MSSRPCSLPRLRALAGFGRDILREQEQHGWGAKVIDRLSSGLRSACPKTKGFSPRNLKYARAFPQA